MGVWRPLRLIAKELSIPFASIKDMIISPTASSPVSVSICSLQSNAALRVLRPSETIELNVDPPGTAV